MARAASLAILAHHQAGGIKMRLRTLLDNAMAPPATLGLVMQYVTATEALAVITSFGVLSPLVALAGPPSRECGLDLRCVCFFECASSR